MSIKSWLFQLYAGVLVRKEYALNQKADKVQAKILNKIISKNKLTIFGKEHGFNLITTYEQYSQSVPTRSYEDILPYIEEVKAGQSNVLTSRKPLYLLMTSGTTAGTKYIPISKSGIRHQINAAMKLLCFYSHNQGNANFMNFKMIFLQGSPALNFEFSIPTARLSGVVYHHIPRLFQRNKLPKYETNIIENWQEKVDKIVEETMDKDISILGGIPPWCIQYFEKLITKSNTNNLKSLFPNLSIYIYGGLDFSSYKSKMTELLGNDVTCLQTFPASEGFFGIQDLSNSDEMLLLVDQGIYYEFLAQEVASNSDLEVINLSKVKLGVSYELIITNESGLYRYRMGDLVQFTSLSPYRLKVVGRTSQFISAFGEHVIGYEIEKVMKATIDKFQLYIEDYHVCPDIALKQYVWYVEWVNTEPKNKIEMENYLDQSLAEVNKYYAHLIHGKIINTCKIISLSQGQFAHTRSKLGKEGGQNKVIRLANNQEFADKLI